MIYKELLTEYKNGTLSPEKMAEVKEEIDKYEAISEFLCDEIEISDEWGLNSSSFGVFGEDELLSNDELQKLSDSMDEEIIIPDRSDEINRAIRRAFAKAGAITAAVAVVVTVFVMLALPGIVSRFFYDPDRTVYSSDGITVNSITEELSVYAEAQIPELGPDVQVDVNANGYGKYDIYLRSDFVADGKTYRNGAAGRIIRNEGMWFTPQGIEFPVRTDDVFSRNSDRNTQAEITALADNEQYYAYVTLDKPMAYSDWAAMVSRNSGRYGWNNKWMWCAVKTSDSEVQNLGFMATTGDTLAVESAEYDRYPLLGWNSNGELAQNTSEGELADEASAERHFGSMMKYLSENQEILPIMEGVSNQDLYSEAGAYVEKNGIQVYGFVTLMDKAHLNKLVQQNNVISIRTGRVN